MRGHIIIRNIIIVMYIGTKRPVNPSASKPPPPNPPQYTHTYTFIFLVRSIEFGVYTKQEGGGGSLRLPTWGRITFL